MTLSYKDTGKCFNEFVSTNKVVSAVFCNVLLASIVLTILMLLIFEANIDNKVSQLFYATMVCTITLLVNSKLLKLQYGEKSGAQDNMFANMMDSNSAPENIKIINSAEPRPRDIEKFLA